MPKFRYVGNHASQLANGRPIEPGEFVDLSNDEVREAYNENLIADGLLIGTEAKAEHEQGLAERRVKSRTQRAEDEEEN